jgi:glycosyltransferase involved in cell wall biosynthesis
MTMQGTQFLVSIIIPVYNYGDKVENAVRSILQQDCRQIEIILIDDGSTDYSAQVCRTLAQNNDRIHFASQPNAGAAAARNHGIRLAAGTYILFLDADDELSDGSLQAVAKLMETTAPDVVIGGHLSRETNGIERCYSPGRLPASMADRIKAYLIDKKIRICNGAIFIKREVLDRGVFPEAYRNGEDLPVFAQALCADKVEMLDMPLVIVNKHQGSLRHQSPENLARSMGLVDEIFNEARLPKEALVWRDRYKVQRALSLMRTLYLAGQYQEAVNMYCLALRKHPAVIFKWSYTRKMLKALFKVRGNWKHLLRKPGWPELDSATYAAAYERWGGSVMLHPAIITAISDIADIPLTYRGCYQQDKLVAAVPVWGKNTLAGERRYLKQIGKKTQLDTGDNEREFPLDPSASIVLPYGANFLSARQAARISNARLEKDFEVGLARSHVEGENKLARKFKYNQKRALRLFEEAGGEVCPISSLSAEEIASAYVELFELRWGFETPGKKYLPELIRRLHNFLTGSVLRLNGRIIAIQLVFMAENKNGVSAAYINGGYDPAYKEHSPGSILCYLNTEVAEQFAISKHKPLRYHFGKMDADYKRMWCYGEKSYRV